MSLPNVLATRYASTEVAAIWSPEHKVVLERQLWVAVLKAQRDLGWRPSVSFETGLERTVAWYLDNPGWWQPLRRNVYDGERLGLLEARP